MTRWNMIPLPCLVYWEIHVSKCGNSTILDYQTNHVHIHFLNDYLTSSSVINKH